MTQLHGTVFFNVVHSDNAILIALGNKYIIIMHTSKHLIHGKRAINITYMAVTILRLVKCSKLQRH